jgi:hypothetical protein
MMASSTADPRPENRALMAAGHYSWVFMVVFVAFALAAIVTSNRLLWLDIVADVAMVAWWFALGVLDKRYHEARLCERCVHAAPLDPQAAVDRWKAALKTEHFPVLVLAALVSVLVVSWLVPQHGWPHLLARLLTLAAFMLLYVPEYVHRRLYPWCPWCRWEDDGDPEQVPELPREPAAR